MSNEPVEIKPNSDSLQEAYSLKTGGPKTGARRRSWVFGLAAVMAGLILLAALACSLALEPLEKAWHLARARQLFRQYRDNEALAELRVAVRRNLADADTILLLARAHRRLGSLPQMTLLLARAGTLQGDASAIERERRLAVAQTGRLREVENYLPEMLVTAGEDGPDVCQAFVQGYFANLRSNDALRLLDAWERSYPDDSQPLFMRAYLWQSMSHPEQAIPLYREGLSRAPHRTSMLRGLAEALLSTNDIDQAEAALAICLAETPKDPRVLYVWAQCAYERGRLEEAGKRLAEAIRVAPDDSDVRRLKGQLDLAQGKFEDAFRELQVLAERDPHDTFVRESLGRALQGLGRTEEAKRHLDYVARAEPNLRRLDRLFRESIQSPQNAELRYEIGTILFEFGSPADAARWMQAALELDPKHAGAHRALAAHFESLGDAANAMLHRQFADGGRAP